MFVGLLLDPNLTESIAICRTCTHLLSLKTWFHPAIMLQWKICQLGRYKSNNDMGDLMSLLETHIYYWMVLVEFWWCILYYFETFFMIIACQPQWQTQPLMKPPFHCTYILCRLVHKNPSTSFMRYTTMLRKHKHTNQVSDNFVMKCSCMQNCTFSRLKKKKSISCHTTES